MVKDLTWLDAQHSPGQGNTQEGPDIRHHWTDHCRITSKFWYALKENTLVYTPMESAVIYICRSLLLELINIKFA